jgi:cholinesterase
MHGLTTLSLLLCASGLSLAAPKTSSIEHVKTANGRITGHRSPKANEVWEYLGIPYAQPPLGDLRFAAPQEYKNKGDYVAANFVSTHLALPLPRVQIC